MTLSNKSNWNTWMNNKAQLLRSLPDSTRTLPSVSGLLIWEVFPSCRTELKSQLTSKALTFKTKTPSTLTPTDLKCKREYLTTDLHGTGQVLKPFQETTIQFNQQSQSETKLRKSKWPWWTRDPREDQWSRTEDLNSCSTEDCSTMTGEVWANL